MGQLRTAILEFGVDLLDIAAKSSKFWIKFSFFNSIFFNCFEEYVEILSHITMLRLRNLYKAKLK